MREAEGNVAIKVTETEDQVPSKFPDGASCSWPSLSKRCGAKDMRCRSTARRSCFAKTKQAHDHGTGRGSCHRCRRRHSGPVVEKLSARKGELIEMRSAGAGKSVWSFISRRAASSVITAFMTDTRGTGAQSAVPRIYASGG